MTPCIRVRISPDRALEVDQAAFEEHRDELERFCRSLPGVEEGPSWRQLKVHTNGNGMMAKLLIALGDLLGVWQMHPSVDSPRLWGNALYPMVLAGSVEKPPVRRVPKPSAGDLEVGVEQCSQCGRMVAAPDSPVHPPVECDDPDCPMENAIKVPQKQKKAAVEPAKVLVPPDDEGTPPGLEKYLRDING
jgi:hypothetical protein